MFNAVEIFHNKSFFYSGYKEFQVVQNYFPMASKLNKANVKKKAKSISTFDFSTLYTTIPNKLLQQVLLEVINWPSNLNSENIYLWTCTEAGREYLTKQTLVNVGFFLKNNLYFTILITWFSSKILVSQWVLNQYHFGPILFLFL